MRRAFAGMMSAAVLALFTASACGPGVASGRAKVAHPFSRDPDSLPAVSVRFRDTRLGPSLHPGDLFQQVRPQKLYDIAVIVEARPDEVVIRATIFGIQEDELDFARRFEAHLVLPSGERVAGEFSVIYPVVNLTKEYYRTRVGYHSQKVRIHTNAGTIERDFRANEYDNLVLEIYQRTARIVFRKPGILSPETKSITLELANDFKVRLFTWEFSR